MGCHTSIEAALDTSGRLILAVVNIEHLDLCVRTTDQDYQDNKEW